MEETGNTQLVVKYAGFWVRLLAFIVDEILISIPVIILILSLNRDFYVGYIPYFVLILSMVYESLFLSSKYKATPGKLLFGIQVVDNSYQKISFLRAFARCLGKVVSQLLLYIGYIMAAFTNKKVALHDMFAGTYVIYK